MIIPDFIFYRFSNHDILLLSLEPESLRGGADEAAEIAVIFRDIRPNHAIQNALILTEPLSEGSRLLIQTGGYFLEPVHLLPYHGQHHIDVLLEGANGLLTSDLKFGAEFWVTSIETSRDE